jgi:hypothetical protein
MVVTVCAVPLLLVLGGGPSLLLRRINVAQLCRGSVSRSAGVGVLGPTAHPGLPLKVFLGVGRCRQL